MTRPLVLVTGARGYLGGRLVARLRDEGTFALRLGSRTRSAHVAADAEHVDIGELRDAARLAAACEGVEIVIHLAAPNEVQSVRDPDAAIDVTIGGTRRLARAAAEAGVRRFIYLSTAHVYGAPLVGRIDERRATRPLHPYAITHRAAEDFVFAAAAASALEPVILRLSNAVGAPADPAVPRWTLLVNDLCRQAVTTGRMELRSAGLARRDFIAMTDACGAIAHLAAAPAGALGDGLINLGSGESRQVIEIVELVASRCEALLGARPAIEKPAPAAAERDEPLEYRIDRLRATGFIPGGDLRDEIDDTIRLCAQAFGGVGAQHPVPEARSAQ